MLDAQEQYQRIEKAAAFLQDHFGPAPKIAVILGSGLTKMAEAFSPCADLAFCKVPHFCNSSILGHDNKLKMVEHQQQRMLLSCGRVHMYEGFSAQEVAFPVRAYANWGVKTLILSNAAGSLDAQMPPGSLMLIENHLNLLGQNPLVGPNLERYGQRFIDLTQPYDLSALAHFESLAKQLGQVVFKGVYAAVLGPSFETAAEIRMLRTLGARAVGMSTVPETIVARHHGLAVVGVSYISNFGAGLVAEHPDHSVVVSQGEKAAMQLSQLIAGFLATQSLHQGEKA